MFINIHRQPTSPHPVLNLGFRIFFLGAGVFAVLTMLLWYLVLGARMPYALQAVHPFYWHGHEMIFGYACAVIAGFLLTAVKTWTGVDMPVGWRLLGIFLPWLLARLMFMAALMVDALPLWQLALMFDILFWLFVSVVVIRAVVLVRQKRQIGIVAKLVLLMACQIAFALAVAVGSTNGQGMALHFALFLVIGIVLTIGRRVLPFFTQKGVAVGVNGEPTGIVYVQRNSMALDRISLFAFFAFVLSFLFSPYEVLSSIFALATALANALRLKNWYHPAIWQKPLLWSLHLAFAGMVLALVLIAVLPWMGREMSLGIHLLALMGIGLMTLAMMARVSLGHTGRNIHQPPKSVTLMFVLMLLCVGFRVFLPLIFGADDYMRWMAWSQACWIGAFALFLLAYTRVLLAPRVDGVFG